MSRQKLSLEKREEIQKRALARSLTPEDADLFCKILEFGLESKAKLHRKQVQAHKHQTRHPREKVAEEKSSGHGRLGQAHYPGARDVEVPLGTYQPGDHCPGCGHGMLYRFKLKKWLTFMAQAPVDAVRYLIQQMRCNACGLLFEDPPQETKWGTHHPSANAGVVLLRYGLGVPGKRLETWQGHFGIPLPDATQSDMIQKVGTCVQPIFEELEHLLAQSATLSVDDTSMKVLDLLSEFRSAKQGDRQGCHGTCAHGTHQGYRINLFYVGRQHAGENLDQLLKFRASGLEPPLQMGDASPNNTKHGHETVHVFCHAHAFRKFAEARYTYPEIADDILSLYGQIFNHNQQTKDMSDQQRLDYHRKHSRPIMDRLRLYFERLFEERKLEPNSPLGQAISYMRKRWHGFTRFLEIPGVPLDNNSTERQLKNAIRYRKNSSFFKTEDSARLGARLMSVLFTATANGVNPIDYLTAIQVHESEVMRSPHLWLPWNYRARLREVA